MEMVCSGNLNSYNLKTIEISKKFSAGEYPVSKNKVLPFTYQNPFSSLSWRGNCVKIFLENSHDVREGRKDENNMKDEYVAYVGTYPMEAALVFIYMM